MHYFHIQFVNAQKAKPYNTKLKLLKTNAAIWFNKICRDRQLQPRYINIKIKGRKQQDTKTAANAIRFLIKTVQRITPQGSPRTPTTRIAATTPGLIIRILNSVFFKFLKIFKLFTNFNEVQTYSLMMIC